MIADDLLLILKRKTMKNDPGYRENARVHETGLEKAPGALVKPFKKKKTGVLAIELGPEA